MLIITGGNATGKTSFLYSLIDAFGEKSIILTEEQLYPIDQKALHPTLELVAIDNVSNISIIKAIAIMKPFDDAFVVVSTQAPASSFPESPYYRVHEMV